MPDGTATRVHLLQFDSAASTRAFQDEDLGFGGTPGTALTGGARMGNDPVRTLPDETETSSYVFREVAPYGPERTRQAYAVAGDTLAPVVRSRKGTLAQVPFPQTVVLRDRLLG
ncbi:hypothetical protein [Streptomyces roseolilacinus]|uniref:Uncharacterized protein n=1 Tax=Streptomyces roseolilacinus TaxID=66904 RepID=A0A918EL98_9ACTN|nr:hypothetical protein [Streptomyces roseolilacinus]GGQ06129.1 hypothetical protein GCM10010249_25910 [Streptomyces roseolilacinus]